MTSISYSYISIFILYQFSPILDHMSPIILEDILW